MSEDMPRSCGSGGKVPPIRICRRKICWETMGYLCHPEQTNLMPRKKDRPVIHIKGNIPRTDEEWRELIYGEVNQEEADEL